MDKLISCFYWCEGGVTEQFLTTRDIVRERNAYRAAAEQALKTSDDKSIRHMLYYRDQRREDDSIWKAHFYPNLVGMTDEMFYERTRECGNGFIGAVHRHE